MEKWTLSWIDYVVFACSLIISACIGFYHYWRGRRQKTTEEFLLGSGNISVWPVAVSLMASFMSAITLLGVPAENYLYSTEFFFINLSYAIGTPLSVFVFLPVFYEARATSAYEYLERRFNPTVRRVASIVFMLQMILYMSIVLYAPALALSAVTGLSKWASILSVGLICTLYTTLGGIKAVVWTDLFQSMLMFVAMFLIIIAGTMAVGGLDEVWERAYKGGRIKVPTLEADPTIRHSIWSLMIGGIFIYVSLYGVSQIQVQRLLTVNSLWKAQLALIVSWPITTLLSLTTCFSGVVMFAYFNDCDPLSDESSGIQQADQLLPYFMMRTLSTYRGLPGLFIAGIFSAALSSVSSFVNSLAAVTLEDFLRPALRWLKSRRGQTSVGGENGGLRDETAALVSKILALFYGLLCIALTYVVEQMSGILQASLTIFGVVGGPLLGLFTLGMCSRTCNSTGALAGFLVSLAFAGWMGFGAIYHQVAPVKLPLSTSGCENSIVIADPIFHHISVNLTSSIHSRINESSASNSSTGDSFGYLSDNISEEVPFYLYRISYMWYAAISWLVEILVATFVTFVSRRVSKSPCRDVKDELLAPFMRRRKPTTAASQDDDEPSVIHLRKLSKLSATESQL